MVINTSILKCIRGDIAILMRGRSGWRKLLIILISNRGLKALFLYRLSHLCWRWRLSLLSMIFSRMAQLFYGVDISYRAEIGPGVTLVHCFGIVVGTNVKIEGDCCIFHGVTLGDRGSEWVQSDVKDGHPTVGRSVIFGAGAKVLGPITIGRNVVIGANSVVTHDISADSVVAGIPGRVVSERPQLTNNMKALGDQYFE